MVEDAARGNYNFNSQNTGIHTVLPNCAKIDLIFMFQERMSKGLIAEMTYSETEVVIYPFYTAKTNNKFLLGPEGRSCEWMDYSARSGVAPDFQGFFQVGISEELWHYHQIPSCQSIYSPEYERNCQILVPAPKQLLLLQSQNSRAPSMPVVSHYYENYDKRGINEH